MILRSLSLRTLLFLGLCRAQRRSLALSAELRDQPKKIAVIGAGIGGTAAAYFLRQEFGPVVKIDVFEPATVGGRLATVKMGDYEYETGGSVIHPLNLHMKHFIDTLGIAPRKDVPSKMAIFDGKELTFEESDWFIVNFIRMLWRYGFNFIRMQMWVESVLDKFMRIYQYQQFGYSFSSVERLLHAMGGDDFLALANQTLEEAMLAEGFSQVFLNDIVAPITRVNYGQSVRIAGFAGAVALAGADPALWAVDGGNKRVCLGLLYHSKADLVSARVKSISVKVRPSKSGVASSFYEVAYEGESGPGHALYDIVLVATPLHQGVSDISFPGFTPPLPSHYPGRYQRIVATMVHGVLNGSYLGLGARGDDDTSWPSDILTTDGAGSAVNSVSVLHPVHVGPGYRRPPAGHLAVWKVFSPETLSRGQLQQLFLRWDAVEETPWLAYPAYHTAPRQRRAPPLVLHDALYYLSGVEWAASAMEMSAIAARNLALLAHHRWHGQVGQVDQEDLHARLRGEL